MKKRIKARVKERKCVPEIKPKAIYMGFCSHDCEAHYRCPVCGKGFGSWSIWCQRDKLNENGTNKYCPHCKEELDGLD